VLFSSVQLSSAQLGSLQFASVWFWPAAKRLLPVFIKRFMAPSEQTALDRFAASASASAAPHALDRRWMPMAFVHGLLPVSNSNSRILYCT